MSSMTVIVRYLALLERWEIGIDWALGRTELVDMGDGVWEGRLSDGRVAEIVIDSVEPSAVALRRTSAAFGVEVADEVRSITSEVAPGSTGAAEELERSVHFPDLSPERRTGAPPLPGEAGTVIELPAAPGQPAQIVPAVEPALAVRGPVEVTVEAHDAELVVRVRGVEHHDDLWVRISDGETGALLAMTRLRPASTPAPASSDSSGDAAEAPGRITDAAPAVPETSGALTFGLDRTLDELHVSVTDNPLARVPGRVERRARWCDELLTRARSCRFTRPTRSRALAMEALAVAASIGDGERASAAERARRFAGVVRWGRVGVAAAALVAVMWALVGWFTGADDEREGGDGSAVVAELDGVEDDAGVEGDAGDVDGAVTDPRDPREAEVPRAFGGPAVYRFDPDPDPELEAQDPVAIEFFGPVGVGEVDVALVGAPMVAAGGSETLTVRFTHSFRSTFSNGVGGGPDEEEQVRNARRTCLSAVNGNSTADMESPPRPELEFLVRLVAVPEPDSPGGPPGDTSVIVSAATIDVDPRSVQTDRTACVETPLAATGLTTIARYTRPAVEIDLEIPSNVPAGLWAVELLLSDGTVARVDAPVTLRITP